MALITARQGVVKSLTLFWTEIAGDNNVQIIVPNGGVWGQPLKNLTAYGVFPHAAEMHVRRTDFAWSNSDLHRPVMQTRAAPSTMSSGG